MNTPMNGNIEMLKLLREWLFQWGSKTCQEAARWGHLDALKWARNNGCPWGARTYGKALIHRNENECNREKADEIINFLVENGCPTLNDASAIAIAAGLLDDEWL